MVFAFRVEDVMYIGPGDHCLPLTVLIGRLESGEVSSGDKIAVPRAGGDPFIRHIQRLAVFNREFERATCGEEPIQFGIVLRDQPSARDVLVSGLAVSCECG
jgi:hypothetical protein